MDAWVGGSPCRLRQREPGAAEAGYLSRPLSRWDEAVSLRSLSRRVGPGCPRKLPNACTFSWLVAGFVGSYRLSAYICLTPVGVDIRRWLPPGA